MDQIKRNPKLGLALGGGGARALAHVGVLKALEQAGIQASFVSGSSMGGLIAALYAAGWSAARIEEEALHRTRLPELVRLVDVSRRRRGLLAGNRVHDYLCELLGTETTFESLQIPLAVVAVDLRLGEEVMLNTGPLVEAVCATIAVPSLFPHVCIDDRWLVDGAILNNVPVDVVRILGAEVVAAVDVTPYLPDPSMSEGEEGSMPAFIPAFAHDFYRAEIIMISALTRNRLCETKPDIVITPQIPPGISVFWGFNLAAEAIAAGEAATRPLIPALQELTRA